MTNSTVRPKVTEPETKGTRGYPFGLTLVDLGAVVVLVSEQEHRDHRSPPQGAELTGEAHGGGGLVRDERRPAAEHRLLAGEHDQRVAGDRRGGRREQALPIGGPGARVERARLVGEEISHVAPRGQGVGG